MSHSESTCSCTLCRPTKRERQEIMINEALLQAGESRINVFEEAIRLLKQEMVRMGEGTDEEDEDGFEILAYDLLKINADAVELSMVLTKFSESRWMWMWLGDLCETVVQVKALIR